jgi:hypothetical protein
MLAPLILTLSTVASVPDAQPILDEVPWAGAHGAPEVRGYLLPDGATSPGTPGHNGQSGIVPGPPPGASLPFAGGAGGSPGGGSGGSPSGSRSQGGVSSVGVDGAGEPDALPFKFPEPVSRSIIVPENDAGEDDPDLPGGPDSDVPTNPGATTPEPSSVVLLFGLGIGSVLAQRVKRNRGATSAPS